MDFRVGGGSGFSGLIGTVSSTGKVTIGLGRHNTPRLRGVLVGNTSGHNYGVSATTTGLLIRATNSSVALLRGRLVGLYTFVNNNAVAERAILYISTGAIRTGVCTLARGVVGYRLSTTCGVLSSLLFVGARTVVVLSAVSSICISVRQLFTTRNRESEITASFSCKGHTFALGSTRFCLGEFSFGGLELDFRTV